MEYQGVSETQLGLPPDRSLSITTLKAKISDRLTGLAGFEPAT